MTEVEELKAKVRELEETCERRKLLYQLAHEAEKKGEAEAAILREALAKTELFFVCHAASETLSEWNGNPGMLGLKLNQMNGAALNSTSRAKAYGELMVMLRESFQQISEMSVTSEKDQRKRGIFNDWKDIARKSIKRMDEFFGGRVMGDE
jgi:hypothetical protein